MHLEKKSSADSEKYPPDSFMGRLRKRKIIATLAGFIGGGWLTYEIVHWILVEHYHLPHELKDVTIVTFLGALLSTVIWLWFRGSEKRPGNVKVEVLIIPLIILLTLVIDLKFIFVMTGVYVNLLFIGTVALCLGIAWVIFKSLRWAASAFETGKKVETLKPREEKPISFPKAKCSIVVLPFVDMSPDRNNEYFSDGLTEEIIMDLSQIHELCVISRNSAMTLKGTKKNTKTIGEELNVQYALEGSVRKVGNDLRITAQLIDAETDIHLWAEKYSGTMDDVFDIQEKVSRSIVETLKLKFSSEEKNKMESRSFQDSRALEYWFRAKQEIHKYTKESLHKAEKILEDGINVVDDNVLLYWGLGYINWFYVNVGVYYDSKYLDKSENYVNKIFHLDPDSFFGFQLKGLIAYKRGDVKKSYNYTKRAFEIEPNNPEVLDHILWMKALLGKTEDSDVLIDRLLMVDPLTSHNHWAKGFTLVTRGRFEDSLTSFRRCYDLDSKNMIWQFFYAFALFMCGKPTEAIPITDLMIKKYPSHPNTRFIMCMRYALAGDKEKALQMITEETKTFCEWDPTAAWVHAQNLTLIDEKEEALDWLESAVDRGFINYPFFNEYDPFLENIRGEPRFKKLMERVKHEWESFEV